MDATGFVKSASRQAMQQIIQITVNNSMIILNRTSNKGFLVCMAHLQVTYSSN